jgi:FkbH-like protein
VITVASTFVAEPLELSLGWLLGKVGVTDSIGFAPYHQVFQELLTPTSVLRSNASGANVLLVRFEDYIRDVPDRAAQEQTIDSVAAELTQAFADFASQAKVPIVLVVFPPSPAVPEHLIGRLVAAGALLLGRARQFPKVRIVDDANVVGADMHRQYDSVRDHLAHIPFTDEHYATIALGVARGIHAVKNTPAKVLVLDCDNTLWKGVVGEDGVEGIQISAAHLQLQDFAIEQQKKGVLICLASKNTEADVLQVLESRSDMHLRQSHLVSHRINWLSKPGNIRSLAQELNLGLDSFVFLDDNPVECAQMHAELPEVITIQVPEEAGYAEFIRNLWMFDKLTVTAEDASRTQMYRDNVARRALEESSSDIEQFLATLDMKIDIATPVADEWPRLEQLTQRTNQFNFTTRRRSAAELQSLLPSGASVLRVRVADRFGDYGIVGLVVALKDGTALRVDTLLLSCRVLGRGVEHAMLRRLGEIAQSAGLNEVLLLHIPTARNVPARAFADSVASSYASQAAEGCEYRMPAAVTALIQHRPGHDPAEVLEARAADEKKAAASKPGVTPGRSERYSDLALRLWSGKAVLTEMASQPRRARQSAVAAANPTSQLEEQLVELWESLLDIDGVGIDDSFFDLGGTSLISVSLFAEIARQFAVNLPLSAIVEAPTIRSLSRLISAPAARERRGMVCLRAGGPRNLFLVHDGLGETLLYHNLARRLPADISVYGIEPTRLPGIPLAHSSIRAMASSYVDQIRTIQPKGPYLLGGMCAGGLIAYEMAACLNASGDSVQLVAILDGATPQAERRDTGIVGGQRLSRLKEAVAARNSLHSSSLAKWLSVASVVARKVMNAASYKVSSSLHRMSVRFRVALLKRLLERGTPWPQLLPPLSVLEIYEILEAQYEPPALSSVPVLLVRASVGEGNDTPFRERYSGDDFGWRRVAGRLELIDVQGGHSSMLQEHAIDSLASALSKHMGFLQLQANAEVSVVE